MKRLALFALSFLALAYCAVLAADQSAATKPDTSVRVVAEDARLDRKLTYKCENKRLDQVLPEISKLTGVRMCVDPGKRFWSVRQRRVTLFLKDMPLREFKSQLETLLDYHFSRQGESEKWVYVLWQDVRGKSTEQDTLKAQKEFRQFARRRAIEETLRDSELALMMSPEQAKLIEGTNPWLAYLAGTPRGRDYCKLLQSIPGEKFDTLMQEKGSGFTFKLIDLPPATQDLVKQILSRIDSNESPEGEGKDSSPRVGLTGISMDSAATFDDEDERTPTPAFWLHVASEGRTVDAFLVTRTDIPLDGPRSTPTVWNEEERAAREKLSAILSGREATAAFQRTSQPDQAKSDPDLEQVADYVDKEPAKDQNRLCFDLERMSELYGLNVMLESYPSQASFWRTWSGKNRLDKILEDVSSQYCLEWTKMGKTMRFRFTDWADRRSWEIPDEWIDAWLKSIEAKQECDLDTRVDMLARLSDEQFDHVFGTSSDTETSSIGDPAVAKVFYAAGVQRIKYQRQLFELYGRLTPTQKKMIWSERGLPFDEIADDPAFNGEAPRLGAAPIYDMTLRLSRETDPATQEDAVYLEMKMRVWLRDLSPMDKERVSKQASPEALAKADTEPVEFNMDRDGHRQPFFPSNKKQVKQALEELKKARQDAAEAKGKQATGDGK